jgi:hypothetical protein
MTAATFSGPRRSIAASSESAQRRLQHLLEAAGHGAKAGAEGGGAGRRHARVARPVVGAVARQDDCALGLAAARVVGAGELEGEVVGLRPARREREDRVVHRHESGEPLGELDRLGVRRAGVERSELQRRRLGGHALADLTAAVADHARAEVVAGVEQAAPGVVVQVGPLAARDQPRIHARIARLEITEVRMDVADTTLGEPSRGLGVLRSAEPRRINGAWTH